MRCSRPLAVESASGLCPDCLRTVQTPVSTPQDLKTPPSDPFATTFPGRFGPAVEPADQLWVPEPEVPTAPAPAKGTLPLPPSPPGYVIIRELGVGGMGAVYLADEIATERQVAIKFLQRPGHPGAFERFMVEVRALALIDHPNIIRVFSSDFLRSNPYFTTEYAPGGCLMKKLEAEGPLDPAEAARLMAITARAIHAAHSAKVLHRDLKPSNIVLLADGLPKVSDFGLAKRLDRDDDLTTGTGPLGSPPYMAPEQTGRDEGAVDARTDVYGLGATLYHLVTGRRPFTGLIDEVIRQVKSEPPVPPRSVRREVPRKLEAIILKCLEKDPALRYQTAEALAEDLDRFAAGRVVEAPLLTWPRRIGQSLKRHRKQAILGTCALAAAIGLVLAGVAMSPVPKLSAVEPPPDPLIALNKELDAGGEVQLIGENGAPRFHRWAIGEGTLKEPDGRGGSAALLSPDLAMLEILPDPRRDRYRVTAKLQHLRANPLIGVTGVFLGLDTLVAPDGTVINSVILAEFSDWYNLSEINIQKQVNHGVDLVHATCTKQPGETASFNHTSPFRHFYFTPAEKSPGPIRVIIFDVSPEGIELYWTSEKPGAEGQPGILEKPGLVGRLPLAFLQDYRSQVQQDCVPFFGNAKPVVPPWHPRRPLGIWAADSDVSIKSVTIGPIP